MIAYGLTFALALLKGKDISNIKELDFNQPDFLDENENFICYIIQKMPQT